MARLPFALLTLAVGAMSNSPTTEAFLEAWINYPHTLLGRKLRPLCLRHLLWLHALKSPLVLTSQPVTLQDLEIAALVCGSSSDEEIVTGLNVKELSPFASFRLKLWHRSNRRRDPKAEAKAFLAYQDDYLKLPETYDSGGSGPDCALPWLLMRAAALIQQTGWSEATVYNLPLGKLLWLNIAFAYLTTGETNVMTDADILARNALQSSLTK